MKIEIHISLLFFLLTQISLAQREDFNLELLMQLDYQENCNDIWGYVDENGDEYALLGTTEATAVIALDGPDAPNEIAYIPGTSSTWRDIKTFGTRAYVTTDVGEDGLLIIDLSRVSEGIVDHFFWTPELTLDGRVLDTLDKCHNLYIDTSTGHLYLSGCINIYSGGILIFDLNANPDLPKLIGAGHEIYSHDVYVNDSLMIGNDIYNGEASIFDVSDPSNPELIALQPTSGSFTHNAWLSSNNDYLFTTDEINGGFLDAYDIRDFDNIKRVDSWRPNNALDEGIIPHNTHYHEGFLHTSWYIVGLVILDARDPGNVVPAAWYDTYDGDRQRFNGAWGAYPFLPSGRVLVSDINTGLYVFEPNLEPVARLEGRVTDIITGEPLENASVRIEDYISTTENASVTGFYKTGTAKFDSVIVHFEKNNYLTHTDTLMLNPGETLMLDAELIPNFQLYTWNLVVLDSMSKASLNESTVQLIRKEDGEEFIQRTGANGQLTQPLIPEGEFELYYGKWGWKENWNPDFNMNSDRSDSLFLPRGYRDYFNMDLGWTTSNTSQSGLWERAVPAGTEINDELSNPDQSSQNDFGRMAYVTGNDDRDAGFDDIDDGDVMLSSPFMDLSELENIQISFDYWFFNAGGNTPLNDSLRVTLTTPSNNQHIATFSDPASEWKTYSFSFDSLQLTRRDSVQIHFTASDYEEGGGHIVEAGIDAFEVSGDRLTTSLFNPVLSFKVYPNPTSNRLYIESKGLDSSGKPAFSMIYNASGQLVHYEKMSNNYLDVSHLNQGTYFLILKNGDSLKRSTFQVIR
ncbi:MAG: choice-of-anchor B family protein [Bacteroidetes bacterium]|jgi:choice-of-anchor B domain-containing protein|nr:choice-of-anchor B family protein [Bacteroidota bacterium]